MINGPFYTYEIEYISPAEILRFFVIFVCNYRESRVSQPPAGRAPTCYE